VSFVFLPTQWTAWIQMLRDNTGPMPPWPALPIPLVLRLPVAALIVLWGARRDARWTVALAAAISVPALWPGALAILAACWPLRSSRAPVAAESPVYHPNDARQPAGQRAGLTA
jgi:hypothetical protein